MTVCEHHDLLLERIGNNQKGIKSLKAILIAGIILIIGALGYFAYAQKEAVTATTELKTIIQYKVLPAINGVNEQEK